jgi:hypothetical protein
MAKDGAEVKAARCPLLGERVMDCGGDIPAAVRSKELDGSQQHRQTLKTHGAEWKNRMQKQHGSNYLNKKLISFISLERVPLSARHCLRLQYTGVHFIRIGKPARSGGAPVIPATQEWRQEEFEARSIKPKHHPPLHVFRTAFARNTTCPIVGGQ